MVFFRFFKNQFLVYIYAESRKLRQIYVAVDKLEIFLVVYIIQNTLAHVVVPMLCSWITAL